MLPSILWTIARLLPLVYVHLVAAQFGNGIDDDDTFYGCRIDKSMQGDYKRQNEREQPKRLPGNMREPLVYEDYFVGPTSIPPWGDCYYRRNEAHIFATKKVGGVICYRCFTLMQRTPNILQAYTNTEDYCHATAAAAKRSCVAREHTTPGGGIVLWRSVDSLVPSFCAVSGRANVMYSRGSGVYCSYPTSSPSTIDNCQRGYQLDVQFRDCTFANYNMTLRCLGNWSAESRAGEQYFALYNVDAKEYRCGMFADLATNGGYATVALANDSSCSNLLINSTHGFEVFAVYPLGEPPWPSLPLSCPFPTWLHGDWSVLQVNRDIMLYDQDFDANTMAHVQAQCVHHHNDIFTVQTRNACNGIRLGHRCIRVRRHSRAVIEVTAANATYPSVQMDTCQQPGTFTKATSITVVATRTSSSDFVPCAHPGQYSTLAIDGRCVNVSVDCVNSFLMSVKVFQCHSGAIIDSRQFNCLATWRDEANIFTYVTRFSARTHGCFMSRLIDSKLHMAWTGSSCVPDFNLANISDPAVLVLHKKGECENKRIELSPDDQHIRDEEETLETRSDAAVWLGNPCAFVALLYLLQYLFICDSP